MMSVINKTTARPPVTFALFAYNQEAFIREAVEGAFSQTYEPLEIILSDDCSTDGTFEIMQMMAEAYEGSHRVRVRKCENNNGLMQHINVVLSEVHTEFIVWAAGDDISLPERTSQLVQPMIENKFVYGVHSSAYRIDLESKISGPGQIPDTKRFITLDLVCEIGESVITQSHAFRRDVFTFFGPFDSELTNEGPVMAFRELTLGEIRYVDKPLILYRRGSGVSTYSGRDVRVLKELEPLKVATWRATSFQQIRKDANLCRERLTVSQIKAIEKNSKFYTNVVNINKKEKIIQSVIKNFFARPESLASLKAAIRVLVPIAIYKKFLALKPRINAIKCLGSISFLMGLI